MLETQRKPHSCSDDICGSAPTLLNMDKQRTYFLFKGCPVALALGLQWGLEVWWGRVPKGQPTWKFCLPCPAQAGWFTGYHPAPGSSMWVQASSVPLSAFSSSLIPVHFHILLGECGSSVLPPGLPRLHSIPLDSSPTGGGPDVRTVAATPRVIEAQRQRFVQDPFPF